MYSSRHAHPLGARTYAYEDTPSATQKERVQFQATQISIFFSCSYPDALHLALSIRISAACLTHPNLANNNEESATLFFDTSSGAQWRYYRSRRTLRHNNPLYRAIKAFEMKQISKEAYLSTLHSIINTQPENLDAACVLMNEYIEEDQFQLAYNRCGIVIEEALEDLIPDNFLFSSNTILDWNTIENRSLIRTVYALMIIHYKLKNYVLAKQWAVLSIAMNGKDGEDEKRILDDCQSKKPKGDQFEIIKLRTYLIDSATNNMMKMEKPTLIH